MAACADHAHFDGDVLREEWEQVSGGGQQSHAAKSTEGLSDKRASIHHSPLKRHKFLAPHHRQPHVMAALMFFAREAEGLSHT